MPSAPRWSETVGAAERSPNPSLSHQLTSVYFEVTWIPRSEKYLGYKVLHTAHSSVSMALNDLEIKLAYHFSVFMAFFVFFQYS